MNINGELIDLLNNATGLPVCQDEYAGKSKSYIVFLYEDENPRNFGDNRPGADTAYIQIQLVTPKNFNYMELKHKIRDTLEANDWNVTNISSFVGDIYQGTDKVRQTIFETNVSRSR